MLRRRVLAVAAAGLLAVAGVATAATQAPVAKTPDPKGDVRSPLDLSRLQLTRGSDGRLRASITLAANWDGDALVADSGPPGSICLKLWTTSTPPDVAPDYLVCVTADADGKLRGSVLHERANQLPERVASAVVTRPSRRTVLLRFSQTAVGKPASLFVAAESTRPGCTRGSCIDTAPDAPGTLGLQLREDNDGAVAK